MENICCIKFKPEHKINIDRTSEQIQPKINQIIIGCEDMTNEVNKLIGKYPNFFTEKIGSALNLKVNLKVTDNTHLFVDHVF